MINRSPTKLFVNLMENEGKTLSLKELSFLSPDNLKKFSEIVSRLISITRDLSGQNISFKAGSKVGMINALGVRVQVYPKVSVTEFCTLIRYAINGRINSEGVRAYENLSWDIGFENVLCTLLCEEMGIIVRNGISRRYKEQLDSLQVIRGRVLWEKNFPWLGGRSKEIFCRYHQLTYNNIDNQIVLSGLKKAFFLSDAPEVKRHVGEFLNIFNSFASDKSIMPTDFKKAEKAYDRLNEHYRVAHVLTKMLIFNLRPDDLFKEGPEEVFGLVLDMAEIFERFIEKFMSDLLIPRGFSLIAQHKDGGALIDANGYHYSSVRPDLEVWQGNRAIGVIDAKYKDYWAAAVDGFSPERKISNEDLYQLFFYQQRMQCKYKLPSLPLALIAAPLPAGDERKEKLVVQERFRRIRYHVGVESEGDVRLFLIPITQFLRFLNKGLAPREAALLLEPDYFNENIYH
jgi:hypothetical protein